MNAYFKELAHMIMSADEFEINQHTGNSGKIWCCSVDFEIYRTGQQTGNSGRVDVAVLSLKVVRKSSKVEIQTDFHVTVLSHSSFFDRKSIYALEAFNWLDEAQKHNQGHFPLLTVNLLKMLITTIKCLHKTSWLMFDYTGYHSLAKLYTKFKHHSLVSWILSYFPLVNM